MNTSSAVSWFLVALLAGSAAIAREQTGSQAEIAFQGYCQSDGSNQLDSIAGVAANFRTFFLGFGVLTGSVETYSGNNTFRAGDNYIDLNGPTWFGLRWRVTGGDFHVPSALLPLPFTNIFLPDLGAEGVKLEASSASRRYTLFYGMETLASGVRVPFRVRVPQNVLGASVVDKIGDNLELGVRALHLSTNPSFASGNLFAPGEDFRASTTISTDALYKLSSNCNSTPRQPPQPRTLLKSFQAYPSTAGRLRLAPHGSRASSLSKPTTFARRHRICRSPAISWAIAAVPMSKLNINPSRPLRFREPLPKQSGQFACACNFSERIDLRRTFRFPSL